MVISEPQSHPGLLRISVQLRPFVLPFLTFVGCWFVSAIVHNPVPRIHDEFSYILMGEILAHGHVESPSPPLPEFFDTFHVLVHPAYVSKYFPAQGVFLALGEKLAGHPAIGVWLSSALACAALVWMLQGWISPSWALLGGFIVVVQYGVYSYWSQTYWGGMVAVLGGALFFGALRRLWGHFSWQDSIWLALGLVILANSRPLEGALAALPGTILFFHSIVKNRRWQEHGFWPKFVLPGLAVLALGARVAQPLTSPGTSNSVGALSFRAFCERVGTRSRMWMLNTGNEGALTWTLSRGPSLCAPLALKDDLAPTGVFHSQTRRSPRPWFVSSRRHPWRVRPEPRTLPHELTRSLLSHPHPLIPYFSAR